MSSAPARVGRWTRRRPSARLASKAVALLVLVVVAGGRLAYGADWDADFAAGLLLATTFAVVGVAVVSRVPENPFGWLLLSIALTSAVTVSTTSADVPRFVAWLRSWMVVVPVGLLPIALLVFPSGRLPSVRWRAALVMAIVGVSVSAFFLAVASVIEPDPLGIFDQPSGRSADGLLAVARAGALVGLFALLLGVLSLLGRLRFAADFERRQVLCLLLGAVVVVVGLMLDIAGLSGAWIVGAAALPVAAGVAILWHRLYDLDLFINRTLVYLGLSAVLLVAFGASVWLGNLLAAHVLPDGAWALIGVALVALSLDPLRRRLQRAVDQLLYGDRNDPYAVVTALGRGLGSATDTTAILSDAARAVARSLGLPYVAIEVPSQVGAPRTAEWGRRHGALLELALVYRGEAIGRLLVAARTVGGRLSDPDRRLLDDIADQVALTVNAVELSSGLQQAREQLVTAREEERRRLRRDLHDGLGPTLAAMVMQLDAASNVLRRDPDAVEPVLAGLRSAAQDAVGDIRRLVYELRPPALDELGLIGAIAEWIARFSSSNIRDGLTLSLDAPSRLPWLSAAVEVAALRIVQEAIANVARHAHARTCRVCLAADKALSIRIEDDGRGLPGDLRPGVGLASMRERAVEVGGTCTISSPAGGGTHVHATLPLPVL